MTDSRGFQDDFAPDGSIWGPDYLDGHVWIIDRDGNPLGTWGKGGGAPGQFDFKLTGQTAGSETWNSVKTAPSWSPNAGTTGSKRSIRSETS